MHSPSSQEQRVRFERVLETLALDASTLAGEDGASITPGQAGTPGLARAAALPCLTRTSDPEVPPELALGEAIGVGGMGEVRTANQPSLGRQVAVKRPREDVDSEHAAGRLIQEAMITGLLEHPGIVPVHALGRDDRGAPLMAMKKIDGEPWSALLADPTHPMLRDDPRDALTFHLDVLVQVCHAVHFAHTRGILHRDLKPDNVMIGRFGEVLVVDWGIAVSLRPDPVLPLAEHSRGLAGTPAWMAPEMVQEHGGELGVHSDVYLLGALLYRILGGAAPHAARSAYQSLFRAFRNTPDPLPDDTPEPLAALCAACMASAPSERPESAEVVRLALLAWKSHRPALELAAQAADAWAAMAPLLPIAGDDADARHALRAHYGACRGAAEQSLRAWPDVPGARETLESASAAMATLALDRGDTGAAEEYAAALTEPDAALQARIAALRGAQAEERERLEAYDYDRDASVGTEGRAGLALFLGVVWTAIPLATWVAQLRFGYEVSPDAQLQSGGIFALVASAAVWRYRRALFTNAINRQVLRGLLVAVIMSFIARLAGLMAGFDTAELAIVIALGFTTVVAMLAASLDWRLAFSAAAYAVAALAIGAWPAHAMLLIALGNLVALGLVAWIWRPPDLHTCKTKRAEGSAAG